MASGKQVTFTFLGATGMVTGSKTLLETEGLRLLIDYGAFQEETLDTETLNKKLPPDPANIDYVILTHGHLDHCGMLPYLVRKGFEGPIFGTAPTLDIARIIMTDSARIQGFEQKKAIKDYKHHKKKIKKFKEEPARPPAPYYFGASDVTDTLDQMVVAEQDEWIELHDGSRFRLRYNSHIIGSCFVELEIGGKTVLFSGDIGRSDDRLMFPPHKPEKGDIVILEGTYGDREHVKKDAEPAFEKVILETWEDKGTLLIPSFAVERTQVVMHIIWTLKQQGKLPPMPVYIDSPMGISVLGVFREHPEWHKLSNEVNRAMSEEFILVNDSKMSRRIVEDEEPKIVVAGSGMLTGGRILNYLKKYIRFPQTRILMVGYQGEETTGRALLEGDEIITVDDKKFRVNAVLHHLDFLSAHADRAGLVDWLSDIKDGPKTIFINHSDPDVAPKFAKHLEDKLGCKAIVPFMRKPVTLSLD